IATAADRPFSLFLAYWGLGNGYLRQGILEQAIPALEHALEIGQTWQFPLSLAWAAPDLGCAYALAGRGAEVMPLLERWVEQSASYPAYVYSRGMARLGEAYLLAGRAEDAARIAAQALAVSRERKERGNEAWGLRLLGEIAARAEPPDVERSD